MQGATERAEETLATTGDRRLAGISTNVWAMGVVSFLTDFSTEMIYPLLPLFLTRTLGASVGFVGILEGLAESTASVLKLFSGWLADRLGTRKPIVAAGYTLSSLSKPLVAVAGAPWQVLVIRFVDRVGKGVRTSPRDALIADSVPPAQRGRAFGLQRTMDHAGAITGPLVAAALLAALHGRLRLVFGLAAVPALLSVLVILLFVREIAPTGGPRAAPPQLTLRPFDRRFRRYLAILLLFTLGNSSDAFLLLRAQQVGMAAALIPLAWVALHVVKMVTSLPAGSLSDRVGRRSLILVGWAIYAAVYLGFAAASHPLQIWALFLVYGVYFGLTEGVEKAFVADLVPEHLRGTAYGVFNFAIGVGAFPASAIMGLLWEHFGPAVAFTYGAALALLAAILFRALMWQPDAG
jgi:MFS family permease